MARFVNFHVVRHGNKESDETNAPLTRYGRIQAALVAHRFLAPVNFAEYYSSTLDRAAETIEIIMGEFRHTLARPHAIRMQEFGFLELPGLGEYGPAMKLAKVKASTGQIVTVADLEEWMPTYVPAARERLHMGLSRVACEIAKTVSYDDLFSNVLVGSHSPFSELLTEERRDTPKLGEAGIIKYTFEIVDGKAYLDDDEVIFPGF